jgi:hypothetical protein
MHAKDGRVYNWDDFRTIELAIEGLNHTSQQPITSATRTMRIAELTENGAWIEMPARCCSVGHTLSLRILAKTILDKSSEPVVIAPGLDEEAVHVTAVVESIEGELAASSQQVLISFRQHTPAEWRELIDYFTAEQTKLNTLIRRTRQ